MTDGIVDLRLGVTGTRYGISTEQEAHIRAWLEKRFWGRNYRLIEFHQGDCVGADEEVSAIIRELHPECKIICHPPKDEKLRAFFECDEYRPPLTYFARNRKIVDESDMLVGFPYHKNRSKGGTWYTINYALKNGVRTGIFHYDGTREMENNA